MCRARWSKSAGIPKAHAQYLIDVKTHLVDKYVLQIAKQGFIAAIEDSDWGRVVETGEHFSLWITSAQRYPRQFKALGGRGFPRASY